MTKIVIKSDDLEFANELVEQLMCHMPDFEITDKNPDVAIADGSKQYEILRSKSAKLPIIVLSRDEKFKPDDLCVILPKPFRLIQLFDILNSVNNKMDGTQAGYLEFNHYELHPSKKEIEDKLSGALIKLTEKEVNILKYLYKFLGEYVSKTSLQKDVWKYSGEVSTHTIETHIYRLRHKVEKVSCRSMIGASKGGYKLLTDE